MVLVAGLDRLEGTKVGPWLSDAEWQDQDLNGTELDGRRLYVRAYFT